MNTYISYFPHGLADHIPTILKQDCSIVEISAISDQYIIYTSKDPISKIQQLDIFTTSFLVIKFLGEQSRHRGHDLFEWSLTNIGKMGSKINSVPELTGKSLRVVYIPADKASPKNLYKNEIDQICSVLQSRFNIKSNVSQPDFQLTVVEKPNYGFIGIKITKESVDDFQPNGLRKEIARLMIYLSNPSPDDVFLDPFCGTGTIPLLRSQLAPYSKIIAADASTSRVNKELFKIPNCEVRETPIEKFEAGKMVPNKIVTDPPWGNIQRKVDPEGLMKSLLNIPHSKNSTFVILTPMEDLVTKSYALNALPGYSFEKFPIIVSGYQVYCYRISQSVK
ncbi:hypothetical protein KC622_02505 [Candidatus Dojkabacteria bacterium]|uniref:Ribosomal RNA large subunit methyltransferase K/L-like methyltransferase domain-containing protein n=1 Tax=Candidatus Dojkabacteria bacterium TaxID=2099670 RepID=A0A955I610_9BACT|nr:hypothetical protein [Candidatus Dojkabacteria bacterium]